MKKILIISISFIILLLLLIKLEINGIIYHNDLLAKKYSLHGIDVSHHQDKINWNKLDVNKNKFVIIKATEGKNFLDTDYFYNFNKAQSLNIVVGVYHYFTMTSTGKEQAKFYISKVANLHDMLPPIIDLEISIRYDKNKVLKELKDMIDILEKNYNKKVIIYVTNSTYNKYIKGEFLENDLWVRNIKYYPRISEDYRWSFWQYSNRGRIKSVKGFVDKNVFRYDNLKTYIDSKRIRKEK